MYIVFDLEFNQDFSEIQDKNIKGFPFEIIQIGAIKLDNYFNIVDSFTSYIKPNIYKKISPFIEELTGIKTEMLINEKSFPKVYNEFIEFIGDTNSILCVWGMSDMRELYKSADYYQQNINLLPKMYINLQPYTSLYFNLPKKTQLKLQGVIEMLKIPAQSKFHNALNDAYYTAEVLRKIHKKSFQPIIYNPNYMKPRIKQIKRVLDVEALIKQFEKMNNREISEEEKSMIILAYNMGKTGQFLNVE
ncbi:MAG TPA: DNA polymerase III [Clostridiales bacterium]|nr:DNA polymerase III [Clostridiales bacterium]